MLPTLAEGSFVLIDPSRAARNGDVVVVNHPSKPITIVKRVASRSADGLLDLRSDNESEGLDSRQFGLVADDRVVGVVTIRLEWPFGTP